MVPDETKQPEMRLSELSKEQLPMPTVEVDEEALLALWEKGRIAWKDIGSATAWVERLRGH